MIDSHCHLADTAFDTDLDAVLGRAKLAGITKIVTIADDLLESEKCIAIAENNEHIFCTVGVHPHNASTWNAASSAVLKALISTSGKVKAIGEIGLDYHYDFSPRDTQRDVFRAQLEIAAELALPVVLHCREAVSDVWSIVKNSPIKKLVLHCCTEEWKDVEAFVERGWLLSFTGIATYSNAEPIRNTIRNCPLEQMMIETDAPYLSPVPHRGKRNEPAFVAEVAKLIAKEKGISFEEVDVATTKNATLFYGL